MGLQNAVVGVGVFSPFGVGGRQWSKSGMTRYISTRNDISTVVINPTMAWRITPSFSVGVGIDYLYAITEAESMVDQSFLGASDAKMYLDGDGDGWGYNVGAMLKLDRFNFGMAYRSNVKVDVSGTAKLSGIAEPLAPLFGGTTFRSDASTSMEFPDIVSFGVSYRPTERLVIDVDWEIYGWSSFDTATLDFATEVPAAGIVDSTSIYDWEDSDQIKIGMEYLVNDQLALRAGYAYLSAQVPDYTLTPISPESDQHNFAVGFGYTTGKIRFDAYYIYTPFKDRKVENQILSGKYENTANYLGMSLSYAF